MNEPDSGPEAFRELSAAASGLAVPTPFAEKAMASLMQLHQELMDEKEKRVELHRALLEKEQTLSELAMYVRLLEERIGEEEPSPEPESGHGPRDTVQSERSARREVEGSAAARADGPSTPAEPALSLSKSASAQGERVARAVQSPPNPRPENPTRRRSAPDDWKTW